MNTQELTSELVLAIFCTWPMITCGGHDRWSRRNGNSNAFTPQVSSKEGYSLDANRPQRRDWRRWFLERCITSWAIGRRECMLTPYFMACCSTAI
jgi:hypothetical protein